MPFALLRQMRRHLTTRLSVLVTAAVVLVVVALGVNFDVFLRQSLLDGTRVRMQHAYQRLHINLQRIESELKAGVAFASKEEPLLASVELINRYQDKANYNTALIDEEKKSLAMKLLERVKFSLNSDMVLYDQSDELLAFARRQAGVYQLGYVSYASGQPQILERQESEREFVPGELPAGGEVVLQHVANGPAEQASREGLTTYQRLGNALVLKSHRNVVDEATQRRLAHLELTYVMDDAVFAQWSKDMDVRLTHAFSGPPTAQAPSLDSPSGIDVLAVSQSPDQYLGVLQMGTLSGPVYFNVALDKARENALVNVQRLHMLLILLALAACMLLFMRYVLRRSLAQPLAQLMVQIRQIKQGNYAELPAPATGDELEEIGQSVNTLARTVAQREAALAQAHHDEHQRATHDALTGLPNRRLFGQRLDQALRLAESRQGKVALVFLDLDQFKLINDTLGHAVGDQLLIQIAQRLQVQVRAVDTLARIGGDEFTVLIEQVQSVAEVEQLVHTYLALFRAPFLCGDHEISTTASIGVALYPQDGQTSEALLKAADLALYKAKDKGRDTHSFFTADLSERVSSRAEMTHALKRAIEAGNQFVLHYQPKVSARTGQVVAAEALVRWQSPDFGFVPPMAFIPLAEESGQIIAIGDWVIGQACHDLAAMNTLGLALNHLSLNVSNVQLRNHDLGAVLQRAIARNALQASQLEVEITESYIAQDAGPAIESLHAFRAMGLQLAIDDFGTGYSSLSYLKKLPFTRLKIDKSFVDGLPDDPDSAAVTRAIIALATNFGLSVTAEGVERADQLAFLQQAGCDEIQGYYYAKPMPLEEFMAFCPHHHSLS
jgi:diguanylate cyclase (GGDEF)-like protein